jgi:GTP-binding protein EngB required for normal cell division
VIGSLFCCIYKGDVRVINNPALGNVYIILGESNTKKSSVIRCLTGIYN